ncbi:unnamed protein product, partial [Discosporangium mesarthrocarpum]
HVDKKWFYLTKDEKKVYLQPEEEVPKPPRVWNKRFILNMMFFAAVARPRMLSNGIWFDGKIGIWPIVDVVTAQSASKSRARGDLVLRPVMVDGEKYEIMIDEVISAIKAKMQRPAGHTIFMQQNGAKPHTKKGVMEAIQAEPGNSIKLETQPSNSPDLNVNDLHFFHSIQQLRKDLGVATAEELVDATLEAFDIYPREILVSKGDNSCKIPNLGKEQVQRKGGLP